MHALIDQHAIVVTENGSTILVAAGDPVFPAVRRYLVDERGQDFATVAALVNNIRVAVKGTLNEAVAVVDGDESDTAEAYRITHGDPVEEVILATALRLTREDADMAPLGAFLKRLERNPSPASRSQLFGWLKAGGFTITRDGYIVGYKSVRHDGLSAHSGKEPVTVVHQDGTTETVTGHVPYPVGASVWMPRHLVDDDRDSACSVGLHVGTYSYAQNFSQQMLVVLVDPADVVSVPVDHSAQKMRVCRLRVAALHDGAQITDTVIEAIRTLPDFDAAEEYARRPENEVRRPSYSIADFASYGDDDYEDDEEDEDCDRCGECGADFDGEFCPNCDRDEWSEDDEDDEDEDEGGTNHAFGYVDIDAPVHGDHGDYSGLSGL